MSPAVGERGVRTRDSVMAEALKLFEAQGFNQTSVQDIAAAAGIARSTLYQYFESKEELLAELLNECGSALMHIADGLAPLGPTTQGFRILRRWLREWSEVYDKYATLFIEWAHVDAPGISVGEMVSSFLCSFNARVARKLRDSGVTGMDEMRAAVVLTAVVLRFNYLRQMTSRKNEAAETEYHTAVLVQLMLFPETPPAAVKPEKDEPGEWWARRVTGSPLPRRRGAGADAPFHTRFDNLSARSVGTINKLMRSGAKAFADKGYYQANVDEIVAAVDLARSTFYKYFDSKRDLLVALSDECAQDLTADARRFGRIAVGTDDRTAQLRAWTSEILAHNEPYRGVYRTWQERSPSHPEIDLLRTRVVDTMRRSLHLILAQVPRKHPLDLRVAHVLLVALIEEVPNAFRLNKLEPTREELAELLSLVLERSLFTSV